MAKILIIEDNKIQRDWAKKELSDHEVVFLKYSNGCDMKELLANGKFDIVLTDLIIPGRKGGNPRPQQGKMAFEFALRAYASRHIKGVGIVSNFQHHLDKIADLSEQKIREWFGSLRGISRIVGKSRKNTNRSNVVVWVDAPVSQYEHYLNKGNLESISEKEIGEVCDFGGDMDWRGRSITLLKPWGKIVSTLLS